MTNLSARKKRTISDFIQATKEIIEKDVFNNVTARKVGEKSGYSYAKIYNYFSDLKELFAYCAIDYLETCYNKMLQIDITNLSSVEKIQKYAEAYFDFFANKPEIFKLIFIVDIEDYAIKLSSNSKPKTNFLLMKLLNEAGLNNDIKKSNIETIHELLISSIHGKLLFLINRRDNKSLYQLKLALSNEINFIFKI